MVGNSAFSMRWVFCGSVLTGSLSTRTLDGNGLSRLQSLRGARKKHWFYVRYYESMLLKLFLILPVRNNNRRYFSRIDDRIPSAIAKDVDAT